MSESATFDYTEFDRLLTLDGPVMIAGRQLLKIAAISPDDIVFPPSYANPSEKKDDPPVYNIDVLDLFKEHNLVLVLQGHLHVTEMLRWQNTTFITGGALSGKWWRGSYHGTPEGFNIVTLRGDRIEWEYLNYGWHARRPTNL